MKKSRPILLFDGVCNLCNTSVRFLLRWETQPILKFSNLQSAFGKKQFIKHSLSPKVLETFVLIEGENIYLRSKAALRLLSYLRFPWPLLKIFYLIPNFIRDMIYNWIANNRYRWFGRSEQCRLPNPNLESRFVR